MEEHDEDVELWYMLGLAHGLHGDRPASSECMSHALEVRGFFSAECLELPPRVSVIDAGPCSERCSIFCTARLDNLCATVAG